MRLLQRSSTGGISFTKDLPDDRLPRYAILSHTWGDDEEEVTYSDVLAGIGTSKAGVGSAKIRFCIEQTRRDGLEHFWSDTCCIDKSSHVELNTALNSMFRWYEKADKCYVYLADVSTSATDTSKEWEHEFRNSRWFTRGWTLQELIAPSVVEFYSCNGVRLGDRSALEALVHASTGIPVRALRKYSPLDFTIGERQEWQQGRRTGKPEDMVYSLLGLLQVSLPAIYGIGKDEAQRQLDLQIANKYRGARHAEFGLNFSIAGALETTKFIARKAEVSDMRANLTGSERRQYVVLQGLGGIGKTQLAVAYAVRYKDDYSAVLWLDASSNDSVVSSFVKIAKQILRAYPNTPRLASLDLDKDLDNVVDGVRAWLNMPMNTRWLLICDNYDNPKVSGNTDAVAVDLIQYLPEDYHGSVLITTRSFEVTLGHCMRVRKLDVRDGLKILENLARRGDLSTDASALAVAEKLDGLPLALATAGAYLSQNTVSFAKYLEHLNKSWAKLQISSPQLRTYENRTIFTTWQISFEQIEQRSSVAANLLRLWAFFDNQDLWFELLAHGTDETPQWLKELTEDELDFERHMRVLCNHGLVEANAQNVYEVESMGYSVHGCVHDWMGAVLNADYDVGLARVALECLASHVPVQERRHWSLVQRRLLGHADRWNEGTPEDISSDPELAWAYGAFGNLYSDQGKLGEAEKMYLRALEGREKALGADHTSMLSTVNNLGNLYSNQGKLGEAEKMYIRALEGYEKALGADHTSTLDTVNNLGSLYYHQGKLGEAEKMYLRALEGREKALGADHTSTLDTVNNLGLLYSDQGKLGEAEKMYLRALEGKEKALGADHTSTLSTVNNLGALYSDQGKLGEAEKMYLRALEGYEKALGADHTSTLMTVNNLGALYRDQCKLGEAEKMYLRALEGYEKALGADHTSTLDTVNNLGSLYYHQGKLGEAEMMYLRALEGEEKALGADHTSTLETANNLGCLYAKTHRSEAAEDLYERALTGFEQILGSDHPSTLNTVTNLGLLLAASGRMEKARVMHGRAVAGYGKLHKAVQDEVDELGAMIRSSGLEVNPQIYQFLLS